MTSIAPVEHVFPAYNGSKTKYVPDFERQTACIVACTYEIFSFCKGNGKNKDKGKYLRRRDDTHVVVFLLFGYHSHNYAGIAEEASVSRVNVRFTYSSFSIILGIVIMWIFFVRQVHVVRVTS